MHDALFNDPQTVAQSGFTEIGERIGLGRAAFLSCMESSRVKERLAREIAAATSLSINATPTMLINGRLFTGSLPYEKLRGVVDEELKGFATSASRQASDQTLWASLSVFYLGHG